MLNLFNREVVGWSLKPRMTADLVTGALPMGWFHCKSALGRDHHSDLVSQCASHVFRAKLAQYGMVCSTSRKGDRWGNAPTESWFNSFKNERVFGKCVATRDAMKATAFESIKVFYNRKRLHSTLGYTSPMSFPKDLINPGKGEKQVA